MSESSGADDDLTEERPVETGPFAQELRAWSDIDQAIDALQTHVLSELKSGVSPDELRDAAQRQGADQGLLTIIEFAIRRWRSDAADELLEDL